jgi:hypothetical protein
MKRRILPIIFITLFLASVLLAGGCNGKLNMVTGCWKLISTGDENGNNQHDASGGLPISMYYNIYPDGKVYMFIIDTEEYYGTYKMDRDTFTFTSDDGKTNESGSFKIDYTATDTNTGNLAPTMMLILDNEPVSVVLQKAMDYKGLLAYKKSLASASPAPAAPAATPAPSAS